MVILGGEDKYVFTTWGGQVLEEIRYLFYINEIILKAELNWSVLGHTYREGCEQGWIRLAVTNIMQQLTDKLI